MLVSLIAIASARQVLFLTNPQGEPVVQIIGWSLFLGITLLAVTTSCYVTLRYPYLSLVATSKDDLFTK